MKINQSSKVVKDQKHKLLHPKYLIDLLIKSEDYNTLET